MYYFFDTYLYLLHSKQIRKQFFWGNILQFLSHIWLPSNCRYLHVYRSLPLRNSVSGSAEGGALKSNMEGTVRSRSPDSGFRELKVSSFSAMFSIAVICRNTRQTGSRRDSWHGCYGGFGTTLFRDKKWQILLIWSCKNLIILRMFDYKKRLYKVWELRTKPHYWSYCNAFFLFKVFFQPFAWLICLVYRCHSRWRKGKNGDGWILSMTFIKD